MGHKLNSDAFAEKIRNGEFDEDRMVKVIDNWCGNYEGDTIQLSIYIRTPLNKNDPFKVIVMAAGNDDFWLTLQYRTSSSGDAVLIFNRWKEFIYDRVPDGCDKEWFFEHGFLPEWN